jgi:hypothetical protein
VGVGEGHGVEVLGSGGETEKGVAGLSPVQGSVTFVS